MNAICVFCGSSDKIPPQYLDAASQMGQVLAEKGVKIIFGGGGSGMMGALADAALTAGGEVVGIIPAFFNKPQLAHKNLTAMEVVETMHQRKARMAELSDAFIALPGGLGTLEEFFEILTWAQIGLHSKPIGLLNTQGYFDPLIRLIEHISSQGFIYVEHNALFTHAAQPLPLLEALGNHHYPDGLDRWVNRDD